MDKKSILNKLNYHTSLTKEQSDNDVLKMLGFNKTDKRLELWEKINYPTSLTLPSFEEEIKKLVVSKKTQILPEPEQEVTD
jgi:hypothetical protein